MGLIEELGTYVATASTRFTLGTNAFLNNLPDEPATASSFVEYGGGPPYFTLGGSLPKYERQRVQVACRSTSSVTARANVGAAWVAVSAIANTTLSSHGWLRAEPVQSPFLMRRDEQGRVLYAFNCDCVRRTTST